MNTIQPSAGPPGRVLMLRISEEEARMFERMAAACGLTPADFVRDRAAEAAARQAQDLGEPAVPPERWRSFLEMLDRGAG